MPEVEGIEREPVTAWLRERTGVEPPLYFEVIEGGRSNLTYTVTDATGRRLVVRRPPLHGVLASAHDMGREHRIITALADSDVPVPATIGYEPDDAVTGAPFYVMEHVEGVVARDAASAREHLTAETRAAASADVVDVLARLHAVEPAAVGLDELARSQAYVERQLKRWHGQLVKARTRELPLLDEVHDRLAADVPAQGTATIVHGDFRLDNLILDPDTGAIRAVLDWELTTLGDPRADLGLLLVYWSQPGDDTVPLGDAPTLVEGFEDREWIARRYAQVAGVEPDDLDYFVAFGYWKLACILEGVYSRYASGAYGESDGSHELFGELVIALGERAADAAGAAGR